MLKVKKSGFTLVEVILACSMFAIVVSGIVLAINRSFVFMENTKLSVRAANLAREGMEMVYNIRDTNRRRQSGERDKYWLSLGNLDNIGLLYSKGVYTLKEKKDKYGNMYIYAQKLDNISDIESFYNDGFWDDSYSQARNNSEIDFSGEYSYWDVEGNEVNEHGKIQDALVGDGLKFYRIVRVFGVYEKNVTGTESRINDSGSSQPTPVHKSDGTPAEMRFCVKVFYVSQGKHSTELCGVITNFME